MKKIVIIVIFMLIIVSGIYYLSKEKVSKTSPEPTPTVQITPNNQTPIPSPKPTITPLQNDGINNFWITVRDSNKISLYSNLDDKLTSVEAKNKYSCLYLVSGGFYTTDDKPIGLFANQDGVLSEAVVNPTYNGFFYIKNDEVPVISSSQPLDYRFALQAGPILFSNGKPMSLSIINDEPARRIVVAISNSNDIVFISFYDANNNQLGPKLADIPSIIEKINENTSLRIESALNLDGGSHSAFLTDTLNLKEISRIGNFFCIKP